jgi:hypothetical protein
MSRYLRIYRKTIVSENIKQVSLVKGYLVFLPSRIASMEYFLTSGLHSRCLHLASPHTHFALRKDHAVFSPAALYSTVIDVSTLSSDGIENPHRDFTEEAQNISI